MPLNKQIRSTNQFFNDERLQFIDPLKKFNLIGALQLINISPDLTLKA